MTPIPKGTVRCVVRLGQERKEILRSNTPEQTRDEVVNGLHGMGVFRLDYIGPKWMLGFEVLTVDVDIERVTAPPEAPPEAPKDASNDPQKEQPAVDTIAADPQPESLSANLTDEIVAIHSRVDFITKAVGTYTYVATQAMKQKFGVKATATYVSRDELVQAAEHLRDLVMALPELYLWKPPASCESEELDCESTTSYEKLRERLRSQSLVIVGGVPIPQRLDEVEKILGARPEWPETSQDSNSHVVDSIERRMREGKIAAVIIAHDLIRHRTFYAMRDAAAKYGVPIAYASKAGIGKLRMALSEIEEMLGKKSYGAMPF